MNGKDRHWGRELLEFLHDGDYHLPEGARLVVIMRKQERSETDNATIVRFHAYDFTDREPRIFTNQIMVADEEVKRFPAMIQSYNLKTFVDLMMRLYDKSFAFNTPK